jgi:hypothetical protein
MAGVITTVVTTAANQAAVDWRRAVLRRSRDPLQLWRTSLESGPVRLVQPRRGREKKTLKTNVKK